MEGCTASEAGGQPQGHGCAVARTGVQGFDESALSGALFVGWSELCSVEMSS